MTLRLLIRNTESKITWSTHVFKYKDQVFINKHSVRGLRTIIKIQCLSISGISNIGTMYIPLSEKVQYSSILSCQNSEQSNQELH